MPITAASPFFIYNLFLHVLLTRAGSKDLILTVVRINIFWLKQVKLLTASLWALCPEISKHYQLIRRGGQPSSLNFHIQVSFFAFIVFSLLLRIVI